MSLCVRDVGLEVRERGEKRGESCSSVSPWVCPAQQGPEGPPSPGFPSGRQETETGHHTAERMTHGIQRNAQVGGTTPGQGHLTLTRGPSTTLRVFYFIFIEL